MSGHVKYERSRSPGEIEGESASHNNHRIMHHPPNSMTYSLVKRKKASQLAVMLATPSHAIESAGGIVIAYSMNAIPVTCMCNNGYLYV